MFTMDNTEGYEQADLDMLNGVLNELRAARPDLDERSISDALTNAWCEGIWRVELREQAAQRLGIPVPGARVEGGEGDDYDTGRVMEPDEYDATHPMNDGTSVLVSWDSGARTWTPISILRCID